MVSAYLHKPRIVFLINEDIILDEVLSVKANHCLSAERDLSYFEVEISGNTGYGMLLSLTTYMFFDQHGVFPV